MIVLYWFGEPLERYFAASYGQKGLYYFVLLYFGGALFSCLPSQAKHSKNPYYSSIGASGATSALVFAYIALSPTVPFEFLFLPGVKLPAIIYGGIILVAEYYLSKRGGTNIAHDAHIYGALYGFAFIMLIDTENFHEFIYHIQHWR
jgi:membrane associated rhomboid family serine protease